MAKAEIDVVDAMGNLTIHVRVKRGTELQWRVWLGAHLLSLVGWIWNCNIEVEGD